MKSVTVKDRYGKIIIKVIHRKNGRYEIITAKTVHDSGATIEVRDDEGHKVMF